MSKGKSKADDTKSIADELADEQLDKVSGGMAINAGVKAKTALSVPTGMSAGSIAEGDTPGGDGMPDQQTG